MIPTKDIVTVVPRGTMDDWGRPVEGTPVDYKCRIDYSTEEVKLSNGEVVMSRVIILIKGFADVSTNDLVRWSDQFGNHEVQPISVTPIKDISSKLIFTKVVY